MLEYLLSPRDLGQVRFGISPLRVFRRNLAAMHGEVPQVLAGQDGPERREPWPATGAGASTRTGSGCER